VTPVTVVWRYLQGRFVTSALTVVSVGLGVSLVIASVLLTRGIKEGFIAGATDYNLIVGAKGSPTQLVLNVVFRMDAPTPKIPFSAYEEIRHDPRVEAAVPVAMGDAYQGFRYMATTEAYFAPFSWRRHVPAVSTGRLFRSESSRSIAAQVVSAIRQGTRPQSNTNCILYNMPAVPTVATQRSRKEGVETTCFFTTSRNSSW